MRAVVGLLRFAYDLVVGDSWPLTAVVATVLFAAALATSASLIAPVPLEVCTALAAITAAPLTVLVEARASVRRSGS